VCVVCFFVVFSVFENVYFDCEFCDSILILFLLSMFEFVTFSIFSSILKNLANENQSFMSFSLVKKKRIWDWKRNRFYFLFFCLRFYQFVNWQFIRFYFFLFLNQLNDRLLFWVQKKKQNRSNRKNKISWWKDCHKKRCFECLWNEQFEFFVIKRILRRSYWDWQKRREEKKFFLFRVFCDRFCFRLLSRQKNRKFTMCRFCQERQ
jgi:hypothetical protein